MATYTGIVFTIKKRSRKIRCKKTGAGRIVSITTSELPKPKILTTRMRVRTSRLETEMVYAQLMVQIQRNEEEKDKRQEVTPKTTTLGIHRLGKQFTLTGLIAPILLSQKH